MTTLADIQACRMALFVRVQIPDSDTLTFTDFERDITLDSVTYQGVGQLMSVTETQSDLRATQNQVTITVTGIPTGNIADFTAQPVKGSRVTVSRGIFDQSTGELLSLDISNPCGRFSGLVNNYSITETWSGQDSTVTISITCSSVIDQLQRKVSGRRTNPQDFGRWAPGDRSMDRVPALQRAQLQFGGA